MRAAHVPVYVDELGRWFRADVADLRSGVRVSRRRAFGQMAHLKEALLVRSGLVAIIAGGGIARRQMLALRYPSELIIPFSAGRHVSIEAVLDTELDVAGMSAFNDALSADAKKVSTFAKVLARERAIACEWVARCGLHDSVGRLAHVLCETFVRMGIDPTEAPLDLPFTQYQLAELISQTSIHVNRTLASLESSGVIARRKSTITVRDWTELKRLGSFDPAYLS